MLRHVWIATHCILHDNGYSEEYTWGVYPSGEVAEADCLAAWDRQYKISRWDDGDIYIYGEGDPPKTKFIIQPHEITYRPRIKDDALA